MRKILRVSVVTMVMVGATLVGVAHAATGWSEQYPLYSSTLWDVSFVDTSHGWAVGNNGTILKTENGGGTWAHQSSNVPDENLFGVTFIDRNRGWVVGTGGTILSTGNGGATWVGQTSGTTEALEAVSFIDASRGWAFGQSATILVTTNGGGTWTAQEAPRDFIDINEGVFVDANHGFGVGSSGWTIRTTDGGQTWTELAPSVTPYTFRTLSFLDQYRGWAAGDQGVIYTTFNGGQTWSRQQAAGDSVDIWDMTFVDAFHGWAVGYNGLILVTTNGGDTWTTQNTPDVSKWDTLAAVSFVDTGHGWAVGGALRIYLDPPSNGTMAASPGSGTPGTTISVRSVTACPSGSSYVTMALKSGSGATLDSRRAANFSSSGAWSGTLTVPSGATPGAAFITATCFGTSSRNVTQEYSHVAFTVSPTLQSITVTPSNPTIPQDATKQFTATAAYSDGSSQVLSSSEVTWESSDTSVATVSASGLASGIGQGQTTITATSGSVSGSTTLTVGPGRPTIVSFSPTSGRPGTRVTITGTHLSGVTTVKFNGTATPFTVQSDTSITTKVPKGATTGPISVTSGAGTATSATNFVLKK